MNNLSNRLKSIRRVWCLSYSLSAMALPEWEIMSDDDPWKVSVFVSAIVELFLSILLLSGAAIAFITSRLAKFFGLEPPCTYIGCSHPLHTEVSKGQRPRSCKSKDPCRGEFCPDCHPSRIHSNLHSTSGNNQEEGSCSERIRKRSVFGSRDHNATEQDLDVSSGHSGECHETRHSCSDSPLYKRRNQQTVPKHTAFVRAASSSKMNEDDVQLVSARSGSESSGGFDAEDHYEISQLPVDSEEEWAWNAKRDSSGDDYLSLARDSEAIKRLEDYNIKVHGISPSLFKSNQAECTEPSPLYAVHDLFAEPKNSKNNFDKPDGHEKEWPSQCREIVQSTDNRKGSSNDFDLLGSNLSWSSINGQTTKNFSVPLKAVSVREDLHRNGGMVDACKEVHLNTRSPVYKDSRNKLVRGVELLDDQCRTSTGSDDLNNNIEQGKQEDSVVNITINLGGNIKGTGSNVSESEKEKQHLLSKRHLEPIYQNVDEDDCLKKGMVAAYFSHLELSSQEAIAKGVQEASLDGADAACEKDGRLSEGGKGTSCHLEHGELSVKDPDKGVKDVFDNAFATKDLLNESASTNTLPQCGMSSEHVEQMALSVSPLEAEDDEEEFILEEGQEEGLDALKVALQSERSVLAALEAELENERNASAVATSEAMAMISRLQEEKSAMQMEVAQLQRMSDEKADYDEQAMALLKEILFKREKENIALEKEVELYRETLLAEKDDEVKQNWLCKETGSPSPQSLRPLLLGEEFLSPIEARKQKQAPWIPQSRASLDLEELNAFSLDQNVNKRSADSPIGDAAASMYFKLWDDDGRPRYHLHGGLHGAHNNSEQLKETGRSVFSTNDEETQLTLQRLWVLEEELQKLRGKDGSGSQSKAHGVQKVAISPTYRRADKILTELWGGQSICGAKSKEEKEVEMDGVAEGFVPIHDVYEVQSTSNRSPPFAEERDPPEVFECISGNSELSPGSSSESFSPARMARHRIQIPPRISLARKLFPSDEAPCTPVFTPQASGWIVGTCSHPEDICDHHELQSQSLVSREERCMTREEIQQLAVRLKALEEDRELLRETLESFKHRDAELNLLQEIAQHLRELRMAGFMRVSGGVFSEDVTATSPSKNRALKKRRYCSDPGQAQLLLLQQKSI